MMTITELVSHLQAIYTVHGDIGVRMDADFMADTQPEPVTDIVVGQFTSEDGMYAVVLYPSKILTQEHMESIGHA
jgi:hypothetical protein